MNSTFLRLFIVTALLGLDSSITHAEGDSAAALPREVNFNQHIRPIFAKHCVACHGGVKEASGVSFIYRESAIGEADSGERAIVPGDVDSSYLIERVSDPDPDFRMPPAEHGPALTQHDVELLKRWIEQGAHWQEHWAFVLPQKPELPEESDKSWPRDELDRFILARLDEEGLKPAREANRAAWLRRVTLDLTGLPPTPDEYRAFDEDQSADAYEQVVDRLLASPAYGERWASMWLDLARYADTMGYEKDPHRNIWPYRDWLIQAFNDDLPFDEFTIKQLAGDLLPDATLEDRIATAFHRNTQTNTEGGTDDEEFRTAAVIDRVNTTWQVWEATTFRCVQCHSHPYDPIRHEEYYKFLSLFNTSRDMDLPDEFPVANVPAKQEDWQRAEELDERAANLRQEIFARTHKLAKDRQLWLPLKISQADSTGQTQLRIATNDAHQVSEVIAEGTISANSTYTIETPLPAGLSELTALRIDALPKDIVAAVRTPEMGFVLSMLRVHLIDKEGRELSEVKFVDAFCDEPHPKFDPQNSLKNNGEGWADHTKISFPRYGVFVTGKPVSIPPESKLRLSMRFSMSATGNIALCIQRGQLSVSDSTRWTELLAEDSFTELQKELAAVKGKRSQIQGTKLPVMAELPVELQRRSFVFTRGNWLNKGKEVESGIPELFGRLEGESADRLVMARWLVSSDNPLTARVMVNRLWEQLFGMGIVETVEDFGTSGTLPSHPELLDHLALRFQNDHQWSVKKLLRDIVLSATYRQSSHATSKEVERDRQNRLLDRGPRQRLTAEMVRDQALLLSGKLSRKMYGKPVMPPQPDGIWRSVYSGAKWETSDGENRYRRAIYTYWKRTSGYPSFITFDMPSREVCSLRRITTNTPLQALVTLNDEAFVELAQAFARRIAELGETPKESISAGYSLAVGQEIDTAKLERLVELYETAITKYEADPQRAGQLAESREEFAMTIVANAMLNLDEVLSR